MKSPLLIPLRVPVFRALWSANIVSNIGTMMQGVGAAWLMTSLTPSTTLVGLVQTSATLPVFLVGILAGALADLMDRKTLLFWSQAWMLVVAAVLGGVTWAGWTTPWTLLGLTFALGLGSAISLPAWQASVQDIVPRESIAAAVSLNSMAFNVARAVGPALGGIMVAAAGAASAFFFNAVSFVAVLAAVASWKPVPSPPQKLSEDVVGAVRAGIRYLVHSPRLQTPMIRAALFLIFAGAVWPLLPLLARDVLHTSATGYGFLLGSFGIGSIVSAMLVPRLRKAFPLDMVLVMGTLLLATAFAGLHLAGHTWLAWALTFFAGMSWVGVLINFNVAVQTSVPGWVRGRAISFYLLVFQGILALDGALWGWLAGAIGVPNCFAVAGGGLLLGLVLVKLWPLVLQEDLDLSPAHMPEMHASFTNDPDEGPVLVTVEYFVAKENAAEFQELMRSMRMQRLRDGAKRWRLYHDMQDTERFLELYRVESWGEHIRQHERMTMDDRIIRDRARALHKGAEMPKITHFLGIEE